MTVVNIKLGAYFDRYIGRAVRFRGQFLQQSPFHNPFRIGQDGTRQDVLRKFQGYLDAKPWLIEAARAQLRDSVLGCWCVPPEGFNMRILCHGQILAVLIDGDQSPYAGYQL